MSLVIITPTSWQNGFISPTGDDSSTSSSYRKSGFIQVQEGEKYIASMSGSASTLLLSGYASNNQSSFIAGSFNIAGGSSATSVKVFEFTIPAGVQFIRFGYGVGTPLSDVYVYKTYGLNTANYVDLKNAVKQVIKENGNEEISGNILQNVLVSIINAVSVGSIFVGKASPSTNPGMPDQNVFYIADTPGVYANFNGYNLQDNVVIFNNKTGGWTPLILNLPTKSYVDTLGSEISGVVSTVDDLQAAVFGTENLTPQSWYNGYVNTSGVHSVDGIHRTSDFIAVTAGEMFIATLGASPSVLLVSAYSSDAEGDFISGSPINIAGNSLAQEIEFEIPSGCTHIRISFNTVYISESAVTLLKTSNEEGLVKAVYGASKTGVLWEPGYISNAGTDDNTSTAYRRSNFISVSEGETLDISMSGSSNTMLVSAYSSDYQGSFLSDSEVNRLGDPSLSTVPFRFIITIPAGVNFIRLSRSNVTPEAEIWIREAGLETRVETLESKDKLGMDIATFSVLKNRIMSRRKPIFSFIFDDLNPSDELVNDVFKDFGMRPGFALQTSKFNSDNTLMYQNMYMGGTTILSHGVTSDNSETSMKNAKIGFAQRNFLTNGWVTNSSVLDPALLPIVKKYYGYAFTKAPMNKGVMPTPSDYNETVDPCELRRIGLETWNKDETGQAAIKTLIDHAIDNNLLITFYGHKLPATYLNSDNTTSVLTEADLRAILSYLQEKRDDGLCEVLAPDDAIYQYYKGIIF